MPPSSILSVLLPDFVCFAVAIEAAFGLRALIRCLLLLPQSPDRALHHTYGLIPEPGLRRSNPFTPFTRILRHQQDDHQEDILPAAVDAKRGDPASKVIQRASYTWMEQRAAV